MTKPKTKPKTKAEPQFTYCPRTSCEEVTLRTCLTHGRKLRKECPECFWYGEPYTPKKKPVKSTKTTSYFEGGYWVFETYDQYGQTCTYSEGFGSETACLKAAKADLARINGRDGYGKCQAIIWPPKVTILGKRIRG